MYKKLNSLLTKHDRQFLLCLIVFSIFIAIIETVGIASILPFISVASDFTLIESNEYYKNVYEFFNFKSNVNFVVMFGVILVFFYILRGILNILYSYFLSKFSRGRTHLFACRLFKSYLGMSYHYFISKNSSELTKSIITETHNLSTILSVLLLMMSELFVVVFIYSAMLYVSWKITLVITIFLGLNAFFLIKKISPIIKKQGTVRESTQKTFFEIINSTLGNFKIIKLQSNGKVILDRFNLASNDFAKSGIITETYSIFPRVFLETLGFALLSLLVMYLVFKNQNDISSSMGILSMFILGLYRLMPSANRLLTGYNQMMYQHKSLDIIHDNLMYDGENLGEGKIKFSHTVKLKNLIFGYSQEKIILENVNLEINKGEKIAFIGPSGSGKSTLVDIIIGLYQPLAGTINIDEMILNEVNIKNWRKKVGYIPQNVYLFDGTVAQNISFGLEFDAEKIKDVLNKAKILNFLETHQDGIDTFVGEGGVMLSGGQKQRIAIARALYQEPEILVLDEATSALDTAIEKEIMNEIYDISEDKTLIIIAHRLSTIDRCEKVYKIENKKLVLQ